MTVQPYDFRQASPGQTERRLQGWLARAAQRASQLSAQIVNAEITWKLEGVRQIPISQLAVPNNAVTMAIAVADAANRIWLVIPRTLLLALLEDFLGNSPNNWPADRELTELEQTTSQFLLAQTLVLALEQTWTGEPCRIRLEGEAPVRAGHARSDQQMVYLALWQLHLPFGQEQMQCLIPPGGPWDQSNPLGAEYRQPDPSPALRQQVASLVQTFPVQLQVVLGDAEVTLRSIAELQPGDVIVLRQKIGQPLEGRIDGVPKLRLWPGTVGDHLAVLIDGLIPEPPTLRHQYD